jgi:hypothetical protein
LTKAKDKKMELIFSPLVYNALILEDANSVFYRYIQQLNPELFSSQIESFESFHSCWVSPQLGLGQITGSQLTQEYSDFLTVLGIPVCAANGCKGKYYRSALLIHKRHNTLNNLEDVIHAFPSLTLAVNSFGSNSGWFFLMATLAKYCEEHSLKTLPNIEKIIQTGSQNGSILSLLTGEAHVISLDCISLEFMTRYYPDVVKDVKIIGWTERSLAPPFVTSSKHPLAIQKKIQELLFRAVTSNDDENLVKARQGLLITGMELNPLDGSSNNDFGKEYFDHINYHKSLINKYFPNLLDSLTPGRLLRDHKVVFVGRETTRPISVISKGRHDDEHWPKADFHFQNYLRTFLYLFLFEKVITFAQDSCISMNDFTANDLVVALETVVKKEIWSPLPYGGQAKIILCSWKGLVHLLNVSREEDLSSSSSSGIPADSLSTQFWNLSPTSLIVTRAWKKKIAALIQELFVTEVNPRNSNPEIKSFVYFSGFMGCSAPRVMDYFDSPVRKEGENSLISELWAIDLSLSAKLIEVGEEFGVYAYISAPRNNDRNDWGNLVIGFREDSILKWRDTISHSSARKYIAPRSYEHIRLHRGVLQKGLIHPLSITLTQSVFLEPKEMHTSCSVAATFVSSGCPFAKIRDHHDDHNNSHGNHEEKE